MIGFAESPISIKLHKETFQQIDGFCVKTGAGKTL